jgi:hypothetical protein
MQNYFIEDFCGKKRKKGKPKAIEMLIDLLKQLEKLGFYDITNRIKLLIIKVIQINKFQGLSYEFSMKTNFCIAKKTLVIEKKRKTSYF